MSHSTGPWSAQQSDNNDYEWEITRNERYIAVICDEPAYGGTAEGNAHLIAESPLLLSSLEDVLSLALLKWGNLDPDANKVFEAAREVIARVKGAYK